MRKSKKLISLLLATVMILSCFACLSSVSAFAAEGETQSTTLLGDVDKNGRVDITDATIIQLYIANVQSALDKFESGEYDLAAADVNGSGVIDISDATAIQLLVANVQPTTAEPTTVEPTTVEPTEPVTAEPTTVEPTEPVTAEPTTAEPTEPVTAEPTTAEPTEPVTAEPTTVEPTVVEPTTVEPTVVEPTTVEPTTVEPTTVEPTTEPAPAEDVYVLAGTTNWLSTGWTPDPDAYTMEKAEDGTYSVTVPAVAAADGIYAVKVVQFIEGDAANAVWHGLDGTDLNVDFMLNEDCDVTVTFNPETGEITVTGDGVVPPVYKLDAIYAVGESGGTTFLNGESWKQDAESNKMTEVADGVYEITYEEVDTNTNYQFKFAANGGWDINWGYGAAGSTNEISLNTPSEATYNGGNATFAVESLEDACDITLRLDISNWDSAKKTGAMITVIVDALEPPTAEPTTVEPTEPVTAEPTTAEPTEPVTAEPTTAEPTEPVTAEPTTAEPTEPVTAEPTTAEPTEPVTAEPTTAEPTEPVTAEPTTAEPTEPVTAEPTTVEPTEPVTAEPSTAEPTEPVTAEPTTVEPTTVEPTTEPAPAEDVYVLAGTTNWLSTGWNPDPDAYTMEKAEDGTYSVTVPAVAAADGIYAVKVVQFIEGDAANAVWHGLDGTDLNVDFMLNEDCDVTVTFNPETGEITVTGDGVVPPVYKLDAIYAVGESGGTTFLNGQSWKQDAESNKMTEVVDGVYEITFEEVDTNTNYQFKFAANGGWDINWGFGPAGSTNEISLDTPSEATYNGGNATFAVESLEDSCNVTLRLDLTNWDPAKKTGAMITVIVDDCDEYPEITGEGDLD